MDLAEHRRRAAQTLGAYCLPGPEMMELCAEFERLRHKLDSDAIDLAEQDIKIEKLRAEVERLWAALRRIDALNDNPAVYNPNIQPVLDATLAGKGE